jgi:hypothetical protein
LLEERRIRNAATRKGSLRRQDASEKIQESLRREDASEKIQERRRRLIQDRRKEIQDASEEIDSRSSEKIQDASGGDSRPTVAHEVQRDEMQRDFWKTTAMEAST